MRESGAIPNCPLPDILDFHPEGLRWIKDGSPVPSLASGVSPYVIDLHNEDGTLRESRSMMFEHDDAAIDHAGRIGHPHEMKVRQGERLVAHFPAVRRRF
jgi:hypothetical protein